MVGTPPDACASGCFAHPTQLPGKWVVAGDLEGVARCGYLAEGTFSAYVISMSLTRQQRRYLERQEVKAARQTGRLVKPVAPEPKRFWTKTKTILAVMASAATIVSALYAFWPALDIIAQPWETSAHPANARFQFKNTGRFTIRDVRFDCLINSANNKEVSTSENVSGAPITGLKSQVIGDLAPGQFITRTCFGGPGTFVGNHPSNIKIDASFRWPIINYRSEISPYFVSEPVGQGWRMVPEKEPK
jgi:hypothetical protein